MNTTESVRRERKAGERGAITVLTGCMFAGKTTQLLHRIDRYQPDDVATFKHAIDDRYRTDAVVAHSGKATSCIAVRSGAELLARLPAHATVVAVDEGHFFDDPFVEVVESLAVRGIDVLVTLLDRDSWGRVFPMVKRLNALADELVMLHATCARCRRPANRTQRLTPIIDGRMVGGLESYEPRCMECWRPPGESPPLM